MSNLYAIGWCVIITFFNITMDVGCKPCQLVRGWMVCDNYILQYHYELHCYDEGC